jgi:hypothetical protein
VSKKGLSERDICTKFITPAIARAGWDVHAQVREEVGFTKGRIIGSGEPPFAEQRRIVAKVEELMALCDELEARLTATATTRRHLLESILAKALSA